MGRLEDLRDARDRNYVAAFAALIPHAGSSIGQTRAFGSVVAVVSGMDIARFNPVMVTDPRADPSDAAAAVSWVRSLSVPVSMQIREDLWDRFGSTALHLGFEPEPWLDPGMALHPIPSAPPSPPELRIELAGSATFDDWHTGVAYGPDFRRIYPATLLDDPAFRLLVGYVGDQPVAGAAAILTGEIAGIYAVGTAEHARRRGFGRAITWAAVRAGSDAGCSTAVLQSSEMAVELYRGMGFVEVCRYLALEPASTRPNDHPVQPKA